MKGFLKQDIYHLMVNTRFYLFFIVAMAVMVMVAELNVSFLYLYVMIFSSSALLNLFSYDTANGWQGYAAAAPRGRRAQVDGRYLAALLVTGGSTAMMLFLSLLSKGQLALNMAFLYGGMMLAYVDVIFPLSYRFGNRNRLVLFIILAILVWGVSLGGSALVLPESMGVGIGAGPEKNLLEVLAIPMMLLGILGMAISHHISVTIMAKKEF